MLGKVLGVLGTTYLLATLTRARLDASLRRLDVLGVSLLGGIGFTVSLLIGDLAFGSGDGHDGNVTVGVLVGSLIASVLAALVLRSRNRAYRWIQQAESADADADGVPDVYEAR